MKHTKTVYLIMNKLLKETPEECFSRYFYASTPGDQARFMSADAALKDALERGFGKFGKDAFEIIEFTYTTQPMKLTKGENV